jgi:hypothetical protein
VDMDSVRLAHVADSITRINVANGVTDSDYDAVADFAGELLADYPNLGEIALDYDKGVISARTLDWQVTEYIAMAGE